jgi:hypothetical protein
MYASRCSTTRRLSAPPAALLDGITRHTREGPNFTRCAEQKGWKQAVEERDQGTFDWITKQVAIGTKLPARDTHRRGGCAFQRKESISDAALVAAADRADADLIDADLGGGLIKQRIALPGQGKRNPRGTAARLLAIVRAKGVQ